MLIVPATYCSCLFALMALSLTLFSWSLWSSPLLPSHLEDPLEYFCCPFCTGVLALFVGVLVILVRLPVDCQESVWCCPKRWRIVIVVGQLTLGGGCNDYQAWTPVLRSSIAFGSVSRSFKSFQNSGYLGPRLFGTWDQGIAGCVLCFQGHGCTLGRQQKSSSPTWTSCGQWHRTL